MEDDLLRSGRYQRRRRLRFGYGWRRCRRCHRPLTDPVSMERGFGPECDRGDRRWTRVRFEPPRIPRSPPPRARPRRGRRRPPKRKTPTLPTPSSLGGLERYVTPATLRAAAIGASCAALPVACPAITAVSTIYDASVAARKVIDASRGPGGPLAGARVARDQVWQAVVSQAASGLAGPAVRAISSAVAASLPRSSNVAAESVRRVGGRTLSQMLTDSVGSAASYAADAR